MKLILKLTSIVVLIGSVLHLSCKKEYSCEACSDNKSNKPPIAIAGPDQVITLPTDSVLLDGSSSSDQDGMISSYLWTKISGPASFNIIKQSDSITKVKSLATGTYLFELKVTDNGGLSAKDTMRVIVDAVVTTNHPPIANAGADQTITLPTSAVDLDGSASTDPENNITSYAWTKISGPTSFNIANPNAIQTQLTNLIQGNYQFELKVTDAGGLFSKDTMLITANAGPSSCNIANRPLINAQLIPIGSLSQPRTMINVGTVGNKILFAGGAGENDGSSSVDIYDVVTQVWSTAELSIPRWMMAVATLGNKIFFAGGYNTNGVSFSELYTNVDIYDATTNTWSVAHLSEARGSIAAAAVGNKIFFAGGYKYGTTPYEPSNKIDIYDISTNSWSTATLSEPRSAVTAVTAGEKIYFAGGWNETIFTPNSGSFIGSDRIDIFDNSTNTWSQSSLIEARSGHTAILVNNNIYYAGGLNSNTVENSVEITDVNTQSTSLSCLFRSNTYWETYLGSASKNNKVVFFLGWSDIDNALGDLPKFDIYDITSGTWSIGSLNQHIGRASIISVNNIIYVAGGEYYSGGGWQYIDKVWKLEF